MKDWFDQYFLLFFPVFFVGMWVLATRSVALTGGWRLLAKRFRTQSPFAGKTWRMQSARMRWMTNYGNALT
ncbi:MAG TPA: hypothetical protein VE133_09670, partial [Candidatus Sulfotelmatobacter sp.]|nr:hypothetical protein [Candidatus Sulfotelmatobacter sp.]